MAERLSLEGLRYAQAVIQAGSFSAAARDYGVTQPALSNGIAALEKRLGARLFQRSTRGVTPTEFGEQILPLISQAVIDLDAITSHARRLTQPNPGNLRMGVSPLINPQLVARAYRAVRELPKAHDLVLREANMDELREALRAGDLDVILIPSVESHAGFEHRIIDSEPVVIVDSHATTPPSSELDEQANKSFILVPDSCGLTAFTNQLFAANDLSLKPYSGEASSYRVLEQWATMGLGAALLPMSKLSSPDAPHQRLTEDGLEVEIFYEAVWYGGSVLAPEVQALTEQLVSSAEPAVSTAQTPTSHN